MKTKIEFVSVGLTAVNDAPTVQAGYTKLPVYGILLLVNANANDGYWRIVA